MMIACRSGIRRATASFPCQHARADHDRMANAIRALAMDAVEQAKSGHPGLPMGAADIATVLFTQLPEIRSGRSEMAGPRPLRAVGRSRLDADLRAAASHRLRVDDDRGASRISASSDSKTPGHPENFITQGVETTTGPLGQGIANAVGMAIAERHLAAVFGDVVDHRTYVLCSDGDLMEGISQEAIALAGHLKLNRLIVLFDDNGITIDGKLSLSDSVDQVKRFESAGWRAERIDGHDPEAIAAAIENGAEVRPSDADRLQDHHRLRRAEQGRQREVARLAARRRRDRGRAQERSAGIIRPFEVPDDIRAAVAQGRPAFERRAQGVGQEASARSRREAQSEFERRMCGELPKALAAAVKSREGNARRDAEGYRHARVVRIRAGEPRASGAGNDRRLRRPHRLQQHPHQVDEGDVAERLRRPLHPLRHPRARHGRRDERHDAAWRHHPLFRHVPRVLGLLPPGDPARRADGRARHPRDDA